MSQNLILQGFTEPTRTLITQGYIPLTATGAAYNNSGPTGPTLTSIVGTHRPAGYWGPAGATDFKPAPFFGTGSNNTTQAITHLTLELSYSLSNGKKYTIIADRAASTDDDIMTYLSNDVTQMFNMIHFRPRHGFFNTSFSNGITYKVIEVGGNVDTTPNLISSSDTSVPSYASAELGL